MLDIKRMSWRCVHDDSFSLDRPEGTDSYLMVFIMSRAYIILDGMKVITEPDTFIIFDRNSPQQYGALEGEEYINAWAEFDSDDLKSVVSENEFNRPVAIGDTVDIAQYFRLLSDCYFNSNNVRTESYIIKAMLTEIFSNSSREAAADMPHFRELLDLRQDIYSHPEKNWSVEIMAEKLHISKPYFQALYKSAFGTTCMADVINSRIEMAKTYLGNPSMSIDEVGVRCGYKSSVHFSRQFKQMTGCSPSKWK